MVKLFTRSLIKLALCTLWVAAPWVTAMAQAQTWPSKPIKMIAPVPPGGGVDILSRAISQKLQAAFDVPVVVENKPGANGILALESVAKSAPDGYTLLVAFNGPIAINPTLFDKLPFDPARAIVPVAMFARAPMILAVHPSVPAKTVKELVALAKQHPGQINYTSPGNGTPGHLSMELFKTMAGINLVHVPYKGSAGALQDNLSGQIPYTFQPVHVAATYIRTGKLKAIAVGSAKRHPLLPEVPTLIEQGLKNADVDMWYGLFLPKGTPPEIVNRYNTELGTILNSDEAREAFGKQGLTPATSTPAELADIVKRDKARWAEIVEKRGIKAE